METNPLRPFLFILHYSRNIKREISFINFLFSIFAPKSSQYDTFVNRKILSALFLERREIGTFKYLVVPLSLFSINIVQILIDAQRR